MNRFNFWPALVASTRNPLVTDLWYTMGGFKDCRPKTKTQNFALVGAFFWISKLSKLGKWSIAYWALDARIFKKDENEATRAKLHGPVLGQNFPKPAIVQGAQKMSQLEESNFHLT